MTGRPGRPGLLRLVLSAGLCAVSAEMSKRFKLVGAACEELAGVTIAPVSAAI
jgi:hypothetical protein